MKNFVSVGLLLFVNFFLIAQESQNSKRKFIAPIWSYHELNSDIAGLSFGFFPNEMLNDSSLTRTYGIRIEAFLLSPFYFLAPKSPVSVSLEEFNNRMTEKPLQKIYGINIASGTFESIDMQGLSATMFIHYSRINNGISVAGLINAVDKGNGVFIAPGSNQIYRGNGIMASLVWGNYANEFNGIQISGENHVEKGNGLQIGVFNKSTNYKGLQIGLWNVNEKRKLPLINWNF